MLLFSCTSYNSTGPEREQCLQAPVKFQHREVKCLLEKTELLTCNNGKNLWRSEGEAFKLKTLHAVKVGRRYHGEGLFHCQS